MADQKAKYNEVREETGSKEKAGAVKAYILNFSVQSEELVVKGKRTQSSMGTRRVSIAVLCEQSGRGHEVMKELTGCGG